MSEEETCPCATFTHPRIITNLPGQSSLAYRVGDYTSFRQALLQTRPGEAELTFWRPGAEGDLALQMVEWWAYLADILTFYNERIANEDYLGPANLSENVRGLIRLLGYRPRPGIGATGVVAALLNRPTGLSLPKGFPIQSKPGPGKQPQIFELDASVTFASEPDLVEVNSPPRTQFQSGSTSASEGLLLKGTVTSLKAGDEVLLLEKNWNGSNSNYTLATLSEVKPERDPRSKLNTRLTFTGLLNLPTGAEFKNYRLLKSTTTAHLWPYAPNYTVISANTAHLEATARQIKAGDPVLFRVSGNGVGPQLVSVSSYSEVIWYANNPTDPTKPPSATNTPAVAIPHTQLGFTPDLNSATIWDSQKASVTISFAWAEPGQLLEIPATSTRVQQTGLTLTAEGNSGFPASSQRPLLLEDAMGKGAQAVGSLNASGLQLSTLPDPPVDLTPPLRTLFNLLKVSRGKTVPREILGSGDAGQPAQEFVLQKSPLTYLLSAGSTSGNNYTSTLEIWVDEVEWREVPSFYGQPPEARVFVTREDEKNQTHVLFGDGENGARLPSGLNNVVAHYRYGSGAEAPAAGTLTVLAQPYPNLKAIRNPVQVGGGSDPDSPEQIKRYAPQSVLTFGRAISADDYETMAAQAPGVTRARSYWTWDQEEARGLVKIYVGDDVAAVNSARIALQGAGDPNRPILVKQAKAVNLNVSFTLQTDLAYIAEEVIAAVSTALLDDDQGLFGKNRAGIGQLIYQSQIYDTCLKVAGTVAVHKLVLEGREEAVLNVLELENNHRYDPGEGGFFQLTTDHLTIKGGG